MEGDCIGVEKNNEPSRSVVEYIDESESGVLRRVTLLLAAIFPSGLFFPSRAEADTSGSMAMSGSVSRRTM